MFEEKRNVALQAPVADLAHPFGFHFAGAGAGFAADYDPVDAGERQARDGAEQWFDREEANMGGGLDQFTDAMHDRIAFNAGSHPDVGRPREAGGKRRRDVRAFGEDLEGVLRAAVHGVEDALHEFERDIFVEQIAHGVDEDGARQTPGKRVADGGVIEKDAAVPAAAVVNDACIVRHAPGGIAAGDRRAGHGGEAFSHAFGVTVGTAGRDFFAADDGVPGGLRPFNG